MKPLTETDIRESFVNALPGDLDRLPIPGLHEMLWDEREFLGWRDPQAHQRGYIVHWMDDRPVGLVVRSSGSSLRPGIAAMCSLCHSPQPATQVRLFTAPKAGDAGANGDTIGTYICEDLACSLSSGSHLPTSTLPSRSSAARRALPSAFRASQRTS